ncbi:MAG TPA: deoxyribodipyrimidine photo-lyase [Prolixibacteraceae bacterium]|nr:deoxyribodipyrimidine photo-lyase [Prolixibacteraceae bacterium]
MEKINVFWFRRDLRIEDNHGLFQALNAGLPVLPVFIFDPEILAQFPDSNDARLTFIHGCLTDINREFQKHNSSLLVYFSSPEVVFEQLVAKYAIQNVFTNMDYEPAAILRDQKVEKILQAKEIEFLTYKDQVLFHHYDVVKADGSPYTVFTPYSRKWKEKLAAEPIRFFESEDLLFMLKHLSSDYFPELSEIGYQAQNIRFPEKDFNQQLIEKYAQMHDFPAENGTSRLGIHLRFGTVSIRKLTQFAQKHSEVFLNELIWRNFYMNILWHFPYAVNRSFKPAYDFIPWRNDETEFERWCSGQTGYPLVDAGMRELNETGFMHNRVRMVVASFLTKHLLIDWRWGEAYFASKLLDYELASNNGGWQWASGSGCDAAPYFRVFNPVLQTKKFDPELKYIRKWVPEFGTAAYPKPIVDHAFARNRAIETYRKALK